MIAPTPPFFCDSNFFQDNPGCACDVEYYVSIAQVLLVTETSGVVQRVVEESFKKCLIYSHFHCAVLTDLYELLLSVQLAC